MSDARKLRDSTQIVLHPDALNGLEAQLRDEFTISIVTEDEYYRIIGSPVEIKEASQFLARNGVNVL